MVIMQTILDGLTLMNVSEFYQDVVTGIVLLVAVMLASARQALSGRRLKLPGFGAVGIEAHPVRKLGGAVR